MRFKPLLLAVGTLAFSQIASAADLFNITGTVTGITSTQTQTFGLKTAEDVLDFPRFENLHTKFTNYTGVEAAAMNIDFRGLGMTISYPIRNDSPVTTGPTDGTKLVMTVPSLGIREEFAGASREESQRLFADFMKKNGGDILNRIMKKLVEVSPNDPIAGNPNSLMSLMAINDFANGFSNFASNVGPNAKEGSTSNLIGIGARLSSFRQNGNTNNTVTLPLSYTVRSDIDPRRQLIINLPVTYTEVEGAKAYNAGFGAAYRVPMNDNWTLTPALNYGVAGSRDLGAFGQAIGTSLSSTYVIPRTGYDLAIGNMVGYYRSLRLSTSGYSYNPDIANTVFRNGILYSQPISAFGKKMSIEYSFIDTRFTGTKLYAERYDEIGVTLGTNKNAQSARSYFRAGATYLFAPNIKGLTLNLGYWF